MCFRDIIEGDTFTVVGRCEQTGKLGVGMSIASMCVASRCPFVKSKVGAVSIQANAEPRLGRLAIKLLEDGYSAPKVLKELIDSDPFIELRQIGVVDKDGKSAAYTGSKNVDWAGHIVKKNYVAMANGMVGEQVVRAMAESFEASAEESLEERLMRAIEAGRDTGYTGELFSAGILVYDWEVFSSVDLRADHPKEPVGELRRILEVYKPLIPYYLQRPADPTMVGSWREWLHKHGSEDDLKRYFLHK